MATNNMPWGDAFIVQTPTLDRWSQQLYQEQKIRQAKQQQEDAALDANIQKEIGKVRSVDTPEVIQAYHDYKQGKKQLLFDKQLQKDPLAYNQAQQKVLQDYQRVFTTANKSAEIKDMQKQLATDRIKNPNAYADDFGDRIATLINTPVSKAGQHEVYGDLTNPDSYRYQGSNTDWSKIVNDAAGKTIKSSGTPTTLPGGLQTSTPIYEYGNTPAQIKDNILGTMAVHQTGRDAAYTWDHIPEADIEKTVKDFQAIPKEDWQKMGLQEPQDIMPKNPDNKAENLASYFAMKHFIANRPRFVENKLQDNKKAVLDYNLNKSLILAGVNHGYRNAEIKLRDELKNRDESGQNDAMDELYDEVKKDALNNRIKYEPVEGQPYDQYQMKATPGMKKIFGVPDGKGHMIYPDDFRFSKDFTKVTPVYLEHSYDDKNNRTEEVVKDKNNRAKVLMDLSKPILESEFKQRWKKEIMGAGAYGKTLKGGGQKTSVPAENKVEDLRKKYNY
jgi:hypothetical protein